MSRACRLTCSKRGWLPKPEPEPRRSARGDVELDGIKAAPAPFREAVFRGLRSKMAVRPRVFWRSDAAHARMEGRFFPSSRFQSWFSSSGACSSCPLSPALPVFPFFPSVPSPDGSGRPVTARDLSFPNGARLRHGRGIVVKLGRKGGSGGGGFGRGRITWQRRPSPKPGVRSSAPRQCRSF